MKSLHRLTLTTLTTTLAVLVLVFGSGGIATAAASGAPPSLEPPATARAVAAPTAEMDTDGSQVNCSSIRELGTKKVVRDKGIDAFTVRQYIGWCWDSRGSAWMNFSSVYTWAQYHNLGFSYRAQAGVVVGGGGDTAGYVVGGNRQRLTYSTPVRTTSQCTQGWGKLARLGSETAQGLTSIVC